MQSYHYAQIDIETGYVISESWLASTVDSPNMISIADDFKPLGKMYVNGEWLPQPESEQAEQIAKPYQPTNAEVAQMISDLQVDLIIAGVI